VYQHPEISRAFTTQHIADFLRAAEASGRARTAAEPAQARRHRRLRWPHAARRLPAPQAGSGPVAGRLGADRQGGAIRYPAGLAANRAPSEHAMAGRDDDLSAAAALSQTRC
jgi:hypothetical protein